MVSQQLQLERIHPAPTAAASNSHVVDGLAGTTYRHGDASAVAPRTSIAFQGVAAHKLELRPETLLPAQWHSAMWDASLVPEKRLLVAVLEVFGAVIGRP